MDNVSFILGGIAGITITLVVQLFYKDYLHQQCVVKLMENSEPRNLVCVTRVTSAVIDTNKGEE